MCFHHIRFVQYTSFNELVLKGLWKHLSVLWEAWRCGEGGHWGVQRWQCSNTA